jgi:hypothetical protein
MGKEDLMEERAGIVGVHGYDNSLRRHGKRTGVYSGERDLGPGDAFRFSYEVLDDRKTVECVCLC